MAIVYSGSLREPIEIANRVVTTDRRGHSAQVWRVDAERKARVTQLRGRALSYAKQQNEKLEYSVMIRSGGLSNVLSARSRILWRGKTLEVATVGNVDSRGCYVEAMCSELVGKV